MSSAYSTNFHTALLAATKKTHNNDFEGNMMNSTHAERMYYCGICQEHFHSTGIIDHVEKSHMRHVEKDSYICGTCAFEDVSLNKVAHHCFEINHAIGRIVRPMISWEAKLMQALEAVQESINFCNQNEESGAVGDDSVNGGNGCNDEISGVDEGGGGTECVLNNNPSVVGNGLTLESLMNGISSSYGGGIQASSLSSNIASAIHDDNMDDEFGIRKQHDGTAGNNNNNNNISNNNNNNSFLLNTNYIGSASGVDLAEKLQRIKAGEEERKRRQENNPTTSSSKAASASPSLNLTAAAASSTTFMQTRRPMNSMVDVKVPMPKIPRTSLIPGPVCSECNASVSCINTNGQVNTNALKRHIWIHHFDNVKPFACSGCKMEFSYKSNFNLHLKRKPNHTGKETLVEIIHDLHGKTQQKMKACFPEYATYRPPNAFPNSNNVVGGGASGQLSHSSQINNTAKQEPH